jgi:BirA family transcriptional regulator, biotin operon repressor / biotin---[acetyl-CoA-carboxylase] ligase
MEGENLTSYLADLPLGGWQYLEQVSSTNDIALAWAQAGAPDLALVVANYQSSGRGRLRRHWVTTTDTALAFSLVLHPTSSELPFLSHFVGLGALAIHTALATDWHLQSQIKWPNDILLNRRKVAGILIENTWLDNKLEALVIGIGMNITPESVPPPDQLMFPAISLETTLGHPIDRWLVLRSILQQLVSWRRQIGSSEFITAWQNALAFKGEWVRISGAGGQDQEGKVVGISPEGGLIISDCHGEELPIDAGDVHMRMAND